MSFKNLSHNLGFYEMCWNLVTTGENSNPFHLQYDKIDTLLLRRVPPDAVLCPDGDNELAPAVP